MGKADLIIKECPILKMDCAITNCNYYDVCELKEHFIRANTGYFITLDPYCNSEDSIGE